MNLISSEWLNQFQLVWDNYTRLCNLILNNLWYYYIRLLYDLKKNSQRWFQLMSKFKHQFE